MNILHINIDDYMGAGLCAYRINKALQNEGINSKMLVLNKKTSDPTVFSCGRFISLLFKIINRFFYYLPFSLTTEGMLYKLTRKDKIAYSLPTSHLNLSKNKLVKDADIIHLHWVNGIVDYPSFFENINKPIVWTLHDENLFCGISHYKESINPNNKLESVYYELKYNALCQIKNLSIVFLSDYFKRMFENEIIIKNAKKYVVNNSVDCSQYKPIDQICAQRILNLDSSFTYFLFIAYDITEVRKGLHKLIEAIKIIGDKKLKILAIGKDIGFEGHQSVKTMGLINDINRLSTIISASDYFVLCSSKEAFAQTPIEAMACGKPAIVFPVSGTEELITPENGVICKDFDVMDLVEGIQTARLHKYNSKKIRNDIMERFAPQKIAKQYIKIYKEILSK